jgi:protoporphyrinogen IX oxidase
MLWVKSLHIVAVITWFAALFYLPRLFVHHAMTEDHATRERFKIMERKLYRGIMTPSLVMVLIFGTWLISFNPAYYLQASWMHVKLGCVLILVFYHFTCWYYLKQFRDDLNTRSHVYYRWFNEIPTVLLLLIVILAVVKPF